MQASKNFKTVLLLVGSIFATLILSFNTLSTPVFSAPNTQNSNQETTSQGTTDQAKPQTSDSQDQNQDSSEESPNSISSDSVSPCYNESGSLSWFVCPTTDFLAKVTDSIYSIIESLLVISPISTNSNSPYHQVWAIFRDITNVIFVIFLLVVIYSQITGAGISNYGIKKVLPKIIVSAILINLSYIICALLVDVSNVVGASLRDLFSSIENSVTATGLLASSNMTSTNLNYVAITSALAGGVAVGGVALAVAGGLGYAFFSLLAILFGAVISILIAFITISARQAFVYILIMISPLAFVCLLLPNTEGWFRKWKSALSQMLFFYPMFAALFGACSLVSWVIISAAESPLMIILGMAVRVVPLFLSWNLLKFSGTIPGQINSTLTNLTKKPLGSAQGLLREQAGLRRAKYYGNTAAPHQYNRRLAQFLQEEKFKRLADTKTYTDAAIIRAQAKTAKPTNRNGEVTRRAVGIEDIQTQNLLNQAATARYAKIADNGLSSITMTGTPKHAKLLAHDLKIMNASDQLAMEASNAEVARYNNAKDRDKRFKAALEAHNQRTLRNRPVDTEDLKRYNRMLAASSGNHDEVSYIAADAAQSYAVEAKIRTQKYDTLFRSIPPTQRLYDQLTSMTGEGHKNSENIDAIISGLRTLGQRGDTDKVKEILDRVIESGDIKLGTHASQSLANYLMFEMGGKDVLLRRYGKYINLETARVFDEGQSKPKRLNDVLSFHEYITGKYVDHINPDGSVHINDSKRSAPILLEGTSLDDLERTAFENINASLRKAYTDKDGNVDLEGLQAKRREFQNAILPAFIGAGGKYLSGSEQIVNAAEFLTGLHYDKKKGVYEKRWETKNDSLEGLNGDFFQDFVNQYLLAQTPTQILTLRTDMFNPVKETLADQKEKELRTENQLPEGYDELTGQEKKEARNKLAKQKFQELLDEKGKLETIYRSRTSGAANNAKDIIRNFLDFNDEGKIIQFLRKRKKERQLRQQIYEETHGDTPSSLPTIFDEADRQYFQDRLYSLLDQDPDSDNYFAESLRMVREEFGQEFIARRYEDFHNENPDATNFDLYSTIANLLDDPENY